MMQPEILFIEPFYGGSHKQLIDLLAREFPNSEVFTQTAKKWHWRARTSALHFALTIPKEHSFRVLFCSSVLNLSELVALRPDLGNLAKVLYFHENQLVYPVRKQQDRDFQYGYNQILSCMVADVVAFNSEFNKSSFLSSLSTFFKTMPDYRPKNIDQMITHKCKVLYFPVEFPRRFHDENWPTGSSKEGFLSIVWPHRWEHDKNPEMFFNMLEKLDDAGSEFNLFILGQNFSDTNEVFEKFKLKLGDRVKHWGYVEEKEDYFRMLSQCDVVVSTAVHEFFGVAMLEAVHLGCYPLCPNALVYPEIFGAEYLYANEEQLFKRLERYCQNPSLVRSHNLQMNFEQYSWKNLKEAYSELFT